MEPATTRCKERTAPWKRRLAQTMAASALLATGIVHADPIWQAWPTVPETQLAEARGGFVDHNGIHISFGFQQMIRINDELEALIAFELPLLGLKGNGAELAASIRESIGDPIQFIGSEVSLSGLNMIIQNSLDNQKIENLRILDLELSGISRLSTLGTQGLLNSSIIDSLR